MNFRVSLFHNLVTIFNQGVKTEISFQKFYDFLIVTSVAASKDLPKGHLRWQLSVKHLVIFKDLKNQSIA